MAENIRIKDLLNEMSTMLTMSLLETGKALRSIDMRTTGKISTSSTPPRLRSTIPAAMEKYHGALDEIESEILRALAVFERDLGALKAKKQIQESHATTAISPIDACAVHNEASKEESVPFVDVNTSIQTEENDLNPPQDEGESNNLLIGQPEPGTDAQIMSPIEMVLDERPGLTQEDTAVLQGAQARNFSMDSLFDIPDMAMDAESEMVIDDPTAIDVQKQADVLPSTHTTSSTNVQDPNAASIPTMPLSVVNEPSNSESTPIMPDNQATNIDLDMNLTMDAAGTDDFDDMFFGGNEAGAGLSELEQGQFDNAFFGLND